MIYCLSDPAECSARCVVPFFSAFPQVPAAVKELILLLSCSDLVDVDAHIESLFIIDFSEDPVCIAVASVDSFACNEVCVLRNCRGVDAYTVQKCSDRYALTRAVFSYCFDIIELYFHTFDVIIVPVLNDFGHIVVILAVVVGSVAMDLIADLIIDLTACSLWILIYIDSSGSVECEIVQILEQR